MPTALPALRSIADRNALVSANLGLVRAFVLRFARTRPHLARRVGFEDLLQHGYIGLICGAQRWDESRGVRFSTYAWFWIRQTVLRACQQADLIRIPCYLRGRQRSDLRRRLHCESLQDLLAVGEEPQARAADLDPGDLAEILEAVDTLGERHRRVVRWRFLHGWTLEAISRQLGVTKERVRQILDAAVAKLRIALAVQDEAPAGESAATATATATATA